MKLMMNFSILVAAYLIGSIPTSYLFGKAKGIDLRKQGSGNVGATNALRVLGPKIGIITLIIDIAKGFLPVHICRLILPASSDIFLIAVGISAISGHIFTIFLKFKGGKGVATSAGVFLALDPIATGITFAVFVIIVVVSRYVSLGSIIGVLVLVTVELITNLNNSFQHMAILILSVVIGIFIIIRHRSNIGRLVRGEENKISFRSNK